MEICQQSHLGGTSFLVANGRYSCLKNICLHSNTHYYQLKYDWNTYVNMLENDLKVKKNAILVGKTKSKHKESIRHFCWAVIYNLLS